MSTVLVGVFVYWLTVGFPSSLVGGSRMDALQREKRLQGSDISNIDEPDVNRAGACSHLCSKHVRCKAMTFATHRVAQEESAG